MDKCSTGHTDRGVYFKLWAIMMDSSERLFISEWRLAFMQNKLFLDIFICVVRQGGFSSSFISPGCGTGSNRTVWMPWCATLINSVGFCRCNPALTSPLGIQDLSWHLLEDLQGICSESAGKSCTAYCAHTLRKPSCFTVRAWRSTGFARTFGNNVQNFLSSAGEAWLFSHF